MLFLSMNMKSIAAPLRSSLDRLANTEGTPNVGPDSNGRKRYSIDAVKDEKVVQTT